MQPKKFGRKTDAASFAHKKTQASRLEAERVKTTVDQSLMRGLDTAGPFMRFEPSFTFQRAERMLCLQDHNGPVTKDPQGLLGGAFRPQP